MYYFSVNNAVIHSCLQDDAVDTPTLLQTDADYGTVRPVSGSPQYCENEGEQVHVDIKEMKCFTCWCRVSDITEIIRTIL